MEEGEFLILYLVVAFISIGLLLSKWGGLAIFCGLFWPVYWLIYLGYSMSQ
jgi:hypothetical protein